MATLGAEFAVLMLISGNWHTLNKLETALDKLTADGGLSISIRKTDAGKIAEDCMPYAIDVVCLDQPGIVYNLSHFFASRNIEIADVATKRYAAAHTGAPMFSMAMTVNIPGSIQIAQIRDEFLEMCDHFNLDAIMEPVKA